MNSCTSGFTHQGFVYLKNFIASVDRVCALVSLNCSDWEGTVAMAMSTRDPRTFKFTLVKLSQEPFAEKP